MEQAHRERQDREPAATVQVRLVHLEITIISIH